MNLLSRVSYIDEKYEEIPTEAISRLKRSQKPKNPKLALALTERDKSILRFLIEFGLVTQKQLVRFTGSSKSALNKRLATLALADFIDRPTGQRGLFDYDVERHYFNALGQRGANWAIEEDGQWLPAKKGWHYSNERLCSKTWMLHQWAVVETYLEFRDCLSELPGMRLINRAELIDQAPLGTPRLKEPWRLRTQFFHPTSQNIVKRSTRPDITCAIGDHRREGREQRGLIFVEIDNNTTDYIRSDPNQSSIAGMYLRYADCFNRGLHTKRYGFQFFRVLIVATAGFDRMQSMINCFQKVAANLVPPSLFLHTTLGELKSRGPLAPIWRTGNSKIVELAPGLAKTCISAS